MNWKSERLTNVLLFIITCILALMVICALIGGIWRHKSFAGKMDGYKMQGQYKNLDGQAVEGKCAYKAQGGCQNDGSCPYADPEVGPGAPATAAAE